ncbi:hypothetical protein C8F01DRAFT_1147925 [Mycena amicta]|nr:hypothetical protein C8F01DRAFT_1147925 [Mycena amicta]
MSLHPALTVLGIQTLPISYRRVATAAYQRDADPEVVDRALRYSRGNLLDPRAIGLLPICFTHLALDSIPSLEALADHDAAALNAVVRADSCLNTLPYIEKVPLEALTALWPGAFGWYSFFADNGRSLLEVRLISPRIPSIHVDLLVLASRFHPDVEGLRMVTATLGFLEHLVQLWKLVPAIRDPEQMESMLEVLTALTDEYCLLANEPERFARLVEGAGGSVAQLARIIFAALTCALERLDPQHNTRKMAIYCLLTFVLDADEASSLGRPGSESESRWPFGYLLEELLPLGFIPILLRCKDCLPLRSKNKLRTDVPLSLLSNIALATQGSRNGWIEQMLRHGLLRYLMECDALSDALHGGLQGITIKADIKKIYHTLNQQLLRRSCLGIIRDALEDLALSTEEVHRIDSQRFTTSTSYVDWQRFKDVADSRMGLLADLPDQKACDNLECAMIVKRTSLFRCSACKALYYCSKACRIADWGRVDGHREFCLAYSQSNVCLTSRMRARLPYPERIFLRAVLTADYQRTWVDVCTKQIDYLTSVEQQGEESPLVTLFDYTTTQALAEITVLSAVDLPSELLQETGDEWVDLVARASHPSGRLRLHVVRLFDDAEPRYVVVPLRCNGKMDLGAAVQEVNAATEDQRDGVIEEVAKKLWDACAEMEEIH